MHGLSINKLTKILFDGGMNAYIWFVVQTEFAKEMNYQSKRSEDYFFFELQNEDVEQRMNRLERLNELELKFLCIFADSNSLYDIHVKYNLPRRYCEDLLKQIKNKLK